MTGEYYSGDIADVVLSVMKLFLSGWIGMALIAGSLFFLSED